MKTVYICAIFAALSLNSVMANLTDDKDAVTKACQQEVPVTEAELDKFFESPANVNDAIKCHLKCIMEKRGLLKEGQFDVQGFLKTMETYAAFKNRKADVVKAAEDCKKQSGPNDCETAFKIFKCLVEHKADVYADQ